MSTPNIPSIIESVRTAVEIPEPQRNELIRKLESVPARFKPTLGYTGSLFYFSVSLFLRQ